MNLRTQQKLALFRQTFEVWGSRPFSLRFEAQAIIFEEDSNPPPFLVFYSTSAQIHNYQRFALVFRWRSRKVSKPKGNSDYGSGEKLQAIVLVTLSPSAHRDPQKTADRLAKCREVQSVYILAGNWDLALVVKSRTQEDLYDFIRRIISKEREVAKTNSLISLKQIEHARS